VHVTVEDLVAALALPLRLVHRQVGVAEQIIGLLQSDRDPDAAADEHLTALDLDHPLQSVEGEARHPRELDRLADVLDEDRELVPAEPRDRVCRSHHRGEPLPDDDQQLIAGCVPEAVVHRLEAVQIGEEDTHGVARGGGAGPSLREAVDEQGAVREARERIVEGLVRRLLGRLRVVQREAGMLREGEDGLALDFAVSPARAARPKRECADQFATLIDGRGDHGSKAAPHDIRYPAGIRTVVLDHDRPPFGHRVTGDADLDRSPAYLIQQLSRIAHRRHDLEHGRILRSIKLRVHQFIAEKLAGARDNRIEHLLDVGAAAIERCNKVSRSSRVWRSRSRRSGGCSAARGRGHGPSRGADPAPPC
jgi:hypothetical protein